MGPTVLLAKEFDATIVSLAEYELVPTDMD
jgi:hypothetical protein